LISLGIDYKAKNKYEKTPLDVAKQQNKLEFIEFLEEVERK